MNIFLVSLLKFYRNYISPMKMQCCRFYPSCSQYAMDVAGKHGFFVSIVKICWRIIRCNPLSKGGYDPA